MSTENLKVIGLEAEHQLGLDPTAKLDRGLGWNLWTGNLIGAAATVALGVYMVVSGFAFGFGTAAKPGAGVFPAAIGGLLALLGVIWLGQTLLGRVRREEEPSRLDRGGALKILVTLGVVIGFALLVDLLGYQLTMLLAIGTLMFVVARSRWWVAALISVGFSFGTFMLFTLGLGVRMPVSSIPFLQQIGL